MKDSSGSMVETAYNIMSKRKTSIAFNKLYDGVCEKLNLSEGLKRAKISQFYTSLSLDKRFVVLKDNRWDLTARRKFSETYVDVDDISIEDEDPEINEEDNHSDIYATDEDN
ncbi:MAG: DNA-directed RNA polymerase subunit delta [Erysipelotrichaceae bacterium]|nr:DNA-directed RNA polymerase subunit delta [Erysipelotrichaceae bacterium]